MMALLTSFYSLDKPTYAVNTFLAVELTNIIIISFIIIFFLSFELQLNEVKNDKSSIVKILRSHDIECLETQKQSLVVLQPTCHCIIIRVRTLSNYG